MPRDPRIKAYAAWPVLVEVATSRTTMTYEQLAARIGGSALNTRQPLDVIGKHCIRNGLPHLTAVIVSKATSKPGEGFLGDTEDFPKTLAAAHDQDWSTLKNPFRVFVDG